MMRRLWALLIALMLAVPAAAHQQKITISTVEHNPRSGMIEVVHRIPLHDAEHALRRQGEHGPDIVGNTDSRRAFARYVADRFALSSAAGEVEMAVLGSEIDGGYLLVYQEGPSPGQGAEISIESSILTDIWTRQVNRVNIGAGTSPTTLIFRSGDRAKGARLP